ncbi:hypothetical protein NQ317_016791 [Molorchus minor]|uniref:Uncharacterized protein n=1 Tax=Molorchus minor TaxID=1323400 RepID=A0ABQ9IUF3_9CUCU|nr:hypothetical protein NQ317_016791 [Molorchus minor]
MAGDQDGSSKPSEGKCKVCGKSASAQSDIKCKNVNCEVVLHSKCFEVVCKVVNLDKNAFKCRSCNDQCNSGNVPQKLLCENEILKKEVECLNREKELLNKYVHQLEENIVLKSTVLPARCDKNLSLADIGPGTSYSSVAKRQVNKQSSVLLIKSSDQNIKNTDVENEVKLKIKPGAFNANVVGTKLIKNGFLINCSDNESMAKLKEGLQREMGHTFKISEPKKLNPRIIVYNVDSTTASSPDLIQDVIHDNQLACNENDIKVVTKLKYKNVFNVVLEFIPVIFNKILQKRLFIYVME